MFVIVALLAKQFCKLVKSEQLAAVDAEFDKELDDSQLEEVAGGADSQQKQIEDISKWGG